MLRIERCCLFAGNCQKVTFLSDEASSQGHCVNRNIILLAFDETAMELVCTRSRAGFGTREHLWRPCAKRRQQLWSGCYAVSPWLEHLICPHLPNPKALQEFHSVRSMNRHTRLYFLLTSSGSFIDESPSRPPLTVTWSMCREGMRRKVHFEFR